MEISIELIKKGVLSVLLCLGLSNSSFSQELDFFDSFATNTEEDQNKSANQLYQEAATSITRNPLAARSKLLLAIKKNPRFISAYNLLSYYYLQQVGHFRMAYKYCKQAEKLIKEEYQEPPYHSFQAIREHSEQLRNLSSILQNLDQYQKALDKLIEYERYGYYDPYIDSSKAWIYFKLKEFDKGIKVAEGGLAKQQAMGANLNILGILYSVNGDNQKGIDTLEKAYLYEKSLGNLAQTATPLNNVGEIYRETFQENKAVNSWETAIRQPDGCDNILPSYNLATINLEALRVTAAQQAVDNFISCFAQYTLKNDEEHKALLHLIQARIYKYQGKIDEALREARLAKEKQQWFGKIGTDLKDLQAALLVETAELLLIKNNHLRKEVPNKNFNYLKKLPIIIKNKIKAKWYYHQAKISLLEQLNYFEDADLRHTDSMLDYSSLGKFYAQLNSIVRKKFIKNLMLSEDKRGALRKTAKIYYKAFESIATNDLAESKKLLKQLDRPFDLNLKLQVLSEIAKFSNKKTSLKLAEEIFLSAPSFVINNALELPVRFEGLPANLVTMFKGSNLFLDNQLAKKFKIKYFKLNSSQELTFGSPNKNLVSVKAKGLTKTDTEQLINDFILKIFQL